MKCMYKYFVLIVASICTGDGRNDSPGYCAKYCTYIMMDNNSKHILGMVVVDKRETELNSVKMKPKAFETIIPNIACRISKLFGVRNLYINYVYITFLTEKQYPNIKHSYDMWHGSKNLGKKLAMVFNLSDSDLETLNNHILMYAAKRFAYSYPSFQARNYLAAIDYEKHLDSPHMKTRTGVLSYKCDCFRYHRAYSKHSKHWRVWPRKVEKEYNYIPDIMMMILNLYFDDKAVRISVEMSETDPRRIVSTIAPIAPPPTSKIVAVQKSRFESKH
ncbi:uncharacterized protein LOC121383828 [Gigantopelta aegis]|uniref:uncharacterized protein LOC121383828 n=1 Tax=Gigantopelta aegis TaxID=1735272 RepID=UPI001B88DEF8|nr:uncharacterized protein LOC121383828 [Gigantopelta aegis]